MFERTIFISMDSGIPSHDDFVRSILANIEIATAYFSSYLPTSLVEKLDFSTLVQLPETYVSDELKKSISDIVYSCEFKGKNEKIKISLLIEHKSFYDRSTIIQIGSYIFSALLKQIKNKEPLSIGGAYTFLSRKEKVGVSDVNGPFSGGA